MAHRELSNSILLPSISDDENYNETSDVFLPNNNEGSDVFLPNNNANNCVINNDLEITQKPESEIDHCMSKPKEEELSPQLTSFASFGGLFRSFTSTLLNVSSSYFFSSSKNLGSEKINLTDPSIQPKMHSPNMSTTDNAYGVLPGYCNAAYENFLSDIKYKRKYEHLYPIENENIHNIGCAFQAPFINLHFTPNRNFVPQPVGYDCNKLLSYKLRTYPYPNAYMIPQDPYCMYIGSNPYVAYPYGVPAVE